MHLSIRRTVVLDGSDAQNLARAAARLDQPAQLAIVAGNITRSKTAARMVDAAIVSFRIVPPHGFYSMRMAVSVFL